MVAVAAESFENSRHREKSSSMMKLSRAIAHRTLLKGGLPGGSGETLIAPDAVPCTRCSPMDRKREAKRKPDASFAVSVARQPAKDPIWLFLFATLTLLELDLIFKY